MKLHTMKNALLTHRGFFMLLMIMVLTTLLFLPNASNQQIAAGVLPTATSIPGNDIIEFLAQIIPGTTRWSEISATLISYGLSPYATYNDQGQVHGYGLPINVPRMGIFTAPYTQDISVGIGVQGNLIDLVTISFNFINEPTPSMPEVQWANIKAVFTRLGIPSHLRIRVSDSATGRGSNLQAYWQDLGWFVTYGVGVEPIGLIHSQKESGGAIG